MKKFISEGFILRLVLQAFDAEFEPNNLLKEYLSELIEKRLKQHFTYQSLYATAIDSLELLETLPRKLTDELEAVSSKTFLMKVTFEESAFLARNFSKIANRLTLGLIIAALLISAALLMQINTTFKLFGYPGFAMLVYLLQLVRLLC